MMRDDALIFENVYDDGEDVWFTEFEYNALFKMSKTDWIAKLVGVIPDERFKQKRLYISTVMCNNKLYFTPYSANEIAVYDMKLKKFKKIPVEKACKEKFFKSIVISEKIYFIPFYYPGILCFDTITEKFSCFDDWIDAVEQVRVSDWGYFIDFEVIDNKLILPCACADVVVVFDLETRISNIIRMKEVDYYSCRYSGICCDNTSIYFLLANGILLKKKLDSEDDSTTICLPASGNGTLEYYPMQCSKGYLYLFSFSDSNVVKINLLTGEIIYMKFFEEDKGAGQVNFPVLSSICDDRMIYISTGNKRDFIRYDICKEEKYAQKLLLSEGERKFLERVEKNEFIRESSGRCIVENEEDSLIYMLDAVIEYNDMKEKKDEVLKRRVGELIWEGC